MTGSIRAVTIAAATNRYKSAVTGNKKRQLIYNVDETGYFPVEVVIIVNQHEKADNQSQQFYYGEEIVEHEGRRFDVSHILEKVTFIIIYFLNFS